MYSTRSIESAEGHLNLVTDLQIIRDAIGHFALKASATLEIEHGGGHRGLGRIGRR